MKTPCIKECKLIKDTMICSSCGRSIEEIKKAFTEAKNKS